jgi:hypothetical protein
MESRQLSKLHRLDKNSAVPNGAVLRSEKIQFFFFKKKKRVNNFFNTWVCNFLFFPSRFPKQSQMVSDQWKRPS